MPATLDDLLSKISEQDATIAKLGTSVTSVVDTQAQLSKAIDKLPPIYPGGVVPGATVPAVPKDPTEEGRFGGIIKSVGHFMYEVKRCPNRNTPTETLAKAYQWYEKTGLENGYDKAIVGSNETFGSDGGFLVPPEYSQKIFARVYGDSALLKKCDQYTVGGNGMIFPRSSETSRATGSRWGGIQAYWIPEAGQLTTTKPTFGRLTMVLHKLGCMGVMTEELMADQSAMPQYMLRGFSEEIDFLLSDSVIRGTGAGQPKGILNDASRVTVTKESGQLAATINPQNIVNMHSRLFARGASNAVWLYNQDIEPQLHLMTLGIGTAGVVTYMPPGGLSGKPYSTLMGLPMQRIEQAETLGTEGDLILVDLSQYVTISKGGMNSAQSMHFYFDTEQQAFRVTFRFDGQPWWSSALTPYKGSATQSWAVTLATRA